MPLPSRSREAAVTEGDLTSRLEDARAALGGRILLSGVKGQGTSVLITLHRPGGGGTPDGIR